MRIVSNTKKFPTNEPNGETEVYFEQRATNELEAKTNYFNQPVIKFPITDTNKAEARDIIDKMFTDMKSCGIGLAHNQLQRVGEATNPYAIFVIKREDADPALYVPEEAFVNPVIVGHSVEKTGFAHGCLSAIGAKGAWVDTYDEVLIAFYSLPDLQLQVKKYPGHSAVICQHEINHLATRGTYIDAVNNWFTGDCFTEATDFYLDPAEAKTANKNKTPPDRIGTNIPCLTTNETLSRSKREITEDKALQKVLAEHFKAHPEDKQLYNNLMTASDTDVPLYGETLAERE